MGQCLYLPARRRRRRDFHVDVTVEMSHISDRTSPESALLGAITLYQCIRGKRLRLKSSEVSVSTQIFNAIIFYLGGGGEWIKDGRC